MARSGPIVILPNFQRMTLSPPRANEVENRPRTSVFQLPTRMPSSHRMGSRSSIRAMSVVVPPMSTMTAWPAPTSALPPRAEAAGPDSSVSTAWSMAKGQLIRLLSDRTTMISAWMPRARKASRAASRKSRVIGMRPAFKSALAARSRLDRSPKSVLDSTAGRPVSSAMMRAAFFSKTPWLRTAKISHTATASTSWNHSLA